MKRFALTKRCREHLSSRPAMPLAARTGVRRICSSQRPSLLSESHVHLSRPSKYSQWPVRLASSAAGVSAAELNGPQDPSFIPDISNHYSIFPKTLPLGPPPAGPFDIHLPSLRAEFLQLQGRFHPDKFPPEQKQKAEALSARINEAYKALQDPLTRAQYVLLHSHGIDVTSEDNSSHPVDPATLMQVMDAQENIENAETEEQVAVWKEENQKRIDATMSQLDDAFARGDCEAARRETIRLRYWASLAQGLDSWDGKGSEIRLQH